MNNSITTYYIPNNPNIKVGTIYTLYINNNTNLDLTTILNDSISNQQNIIITIDEYTKLLNINQQVQDTILKLITIIEQKNNIEKENINNINQLNKNYINILNQLKKDDKK